MFPTSELGYKFSDELTLDSFMYPRSLNYPLTESFELGGIRISDTSTGLMSHVWKCWTDGTSVWLKRIDTEEIVLLYTGENITEVDITFDQNMHYNLTYVDNGVSYFLWYDSLDSKYNTKILGSLNIRPRVSLDDKRIFNLINSDIILAYQRDNKLYYCLQRERYEFEYLIKVSEKKRILWRIGMGTKNCFLFFWR